jgi:putative membrane protein
VEVTVMWWHGDWSWWGWLAMSVTMLAFWGVVAWAVVGLFRRTGESELRNPEAFLAERFAKGEIDEDEYRRRLEVLRDDQAAARH